MAYSASQYVEAWLHIDEIRTEKFSIGKRQSNPLTQDLHHAVTNLSAELYTKDAHFLMELIQNAEDNEYHDSVEATLEFVLTKEDITGTGSPATLLIFNNEVGFSKKNMDSLCSVGRSTKKGNRTQGFIGEKGIGFKSVFLVSCQPHLFSNGYEVRFTEEPDPHCGIGYIVPEWLTERQYLSNIHRVYGCEKTLPTTTLVLPLKPEKVKAVKRQLSALHPETLLFLSKIKRLYVREDGFDPQLGENVSIVSLSSETDLVDLSNIGSDSRVVQLSVRERSSDKDETCKYFMWRHAFPVNPEKRIASRADVANWTVTLAFPFGERLRRGTSSVGVFAFLPTEMITGFPFVIQADFILASSRESILLDNPWNLGILECVPMAFVNAFQACVDDGLCFSSMSQVFQFLPARASPYPVLNKIRESIRNQLQERKVVPCEFSDSCRAQPDEVARIQPRFRDILTRINNNEGCLSGLSTLRKVLHSSVDRNELSSALNFLGVKEDIEWYAKCLKSCKLVTQASPKIYAELLCFCTEQRNILPHRYFWKIPLIKYTNREGKIGICSISQIEKGEVEVKYASNSERHMWLNKCNVEFGCPNNMYFFPDDTMNYLTRHSLRQSIFYWLSHRAQASSIDIDWYACALYNSIPIEKKNLILLVSHFLYVAHEKRFINESKVFELCSKMPIIDGSGRVVKGRTVTLVPASESKWVQLFGVINPYFEHNYADIGSVYAKGGSFMGNCISDDSVLKFISRYSRAIDLPELAPPDAELKITSSQLSKDQAFLLLDWIRLLRSKGSNMPEKFLGSIQSGNWVKTCNGYNSPKQSFLLDVAGNLLYEMVKHIFSDICLIEKDFYGERINNYQDELKFLGVGIHSEDVKRMISTRFATLAASPIKKEWVFSLLLYIGFLKHKKVVDDEWLKAVKKGKWMKTHRGYNAPEKCVILHSTVDSDSFSRIMNIPVIDEEYYGRKIGAFLPELKLLGVTSDIDALYRLVAENASFSATLSSVTSGCGLLVLQCIKHLGCTASTSLVERIAGQSWLKTTSGFKRPSETILSNSTWDFLVKAFEIPAIDELYYDNAMKDLSNELSVVGVAVDCVRIAEIIASKFESVFISSKLAPQNVLQMLQCYREIRQNFPSECSVLQWLSTEKWLKTRHGFQAPKEAIIWSSRWGEITYFIDLPLIDDSFYGISIYRFMEELQMLGVITSFKEGADIVLNGLNGPIEPKCVTSNGTIALLECMKEATKGFSDNFLHNIAKSGFLKTTSGYLVPEQCVLFDSEWKEILIETDLPSLDLKYYETDLDLFKAELRAIGVKTDPVEVCSLISESLFSQSDTHLILRLYKFLRKFDWIPKNLDGQNFSRIWIPGHNGGEGKWVNSEHVVVHDTDELFISRLYSLYSYYEEDLLPLFSSAFGVREFPSVHEYLQLWNDWGFESDRQVSPTNCYFLWENISRNWTPETELTFRQSLVKVPAITCLDNKIHLVNKDHVFIPDDLRLKKLFSKSSVPLFVWVPLQGISSPSSLSQKLLEIYRSLGVRNLSECVIYTISADKPKNLIQRSGLIKKGLIKIVLTFLAARCVDLPAKVRREYAKTLLRLKVYISDQPIKVKYSLTSPPNEILDIETEKMVFWDKNSRYMIVNRSGYTDEKYSVEFASCFAEEIAHGVMPNGKESVSSSLVSIIHNGFMHGFEDKAVDFLLVRENLEPFAEDESFLDSASAVTHPKRSYEDSMQLAPLTPSVLSKKQRRLIL